MGWRDINMNRRKLPLRLAVIPLQPGDDHQSAVLRKVAITAAASLGAQMPEGAALQDAVAIKLKSFFAGYVMGYARQAALAHEVDCEAKDGVLLHQLTAEIARQLPVDSHADPEGLVFVVRETNGRTPRSRFRLAGGTLDPLADAGYLAGHLEAHCLSSILMGKALTWFRAGGPEASAAFLTDCDNAADPMQTRAPTLSLRFTTEERGVVRAAFERFASS